MDDNSCNILIRFAQKVDGWPGKIALSTDGRTFTYREVLNDSARVSDHVRSCGTAGERVGLLAPNSMEFVSAFYGILGADKVVIPFNVLLAPQELAAQATHAEIGLLLISTSMEPLAKAAAVLMKKPFEIMTVGALLASGPPQPQSRIVLKRHGDDAAVHLYTSGTTGQPKGVMLSHRNLLANCVCYMDIFNFNKADTVVCILPFHHSFAMTTILLGSFLAGAEVRIVPRFVPKAVLQELYNASSGVFLAVPSFFAMLARSAPEDTPPLVNLRLVVSGGAALLPGIQEEFERRFQVKILQGYGLTEASPVVASNTPENNVDGTVGPPLPGVEVQVWNDQEEVLPPGEVGELVVRGESVMLGYFKDPAITAATLVRGWLKTGDLAILDEDGYIRIAGRKKELIISAGDNIFPAEVENVLLQHPQIAEAAVIGVPDDLKGEVPKAFIVVNNGARIDLAELRVFCIERLAIYKVPAYIEIIDEIPKTSAGKISRRDLAQINGQPVR